MAWDVGQFDQTAISEAHTLRRKEIQFNQVIERGFENMDKLFEMYKDQAGREVMRYIASCAVKDITTIDVKYPLNWKESLKERFAPKWYLNKHPVKYHIEKHEILAYYPDVAIQDKRHIVLHTMNGMPPISPNVRKARQGDQS